MNHVPKNYYHALATMIGYIVGVGMFGLPFVVAKAGFLSFLVLLVFLGFVQYFIHLIYANVIIATKSYHRLPGYAEIYLGKPGKYIVFAFKLFGNLGGLLAYIIITGLFVHQLLGPYLGGTPFLYSTALFAIEATILYFGIGAIARAELIMTFLLVLVVGLITWRGLEVINITNYSIASWQYFILPYGAMLLALDGGGALPIVAKLLKKDKQAVKSVVRWATFISALLVLVFVSVIVGISGVNTSADSLSGVKAVLDDGVVFFSLIFGVLTMVTSFFGVAESVKETLWWDFKFNKTLAWAIAVFFPYSLFLFGIGDLSEVVSIVGAIGSGFCGIILMFIFMRLKKRKLALPMFEGRRPGDLIVLFFILIFLSGIIYQVAQLF